MSENKVVKSEEDLFAPQTVRAKKLLQKIEEFNNLADYFKSEEAKEILSKELNIKVGEKYAECDSENPRKEYNYISPVNFVIDYEMNWLEQYSYNNGRAFIKADMVGVLKDGSIGKRVLNTYKKRKGDTFQDSFYFRKLDSSFVPGKRREYMGVDDALAFIQKTKHEDVLQFEVYKKTRDSFAKYGIETDFQFIREMPSNNIYANRFLMKSKGFNKLFDESSKLNYPCMLHNPEPYKSRAEALIKDGYLDRMIITKVTKEINSFLKKNGFEKKTMEFNFSGNGIAMFRQATLYFKTERGPGFSIGSSFEVEIYN